MSISIHRGKHLLASDSDYVKKGGDPKPPRPSAPPPQKPTPPPSPKQPKK